MNLVSRIKKLEAIRNTPLTPKEISDVVDWFEQEWFPYDKEAELLLDKACGRGKAENPNVTTDGDKENYWRQFGDRLAAHIKKHGVTCPLSVRRFLA